MLELRCMFMICIAECWNIMIDHYRSGDCEDLRNRLDCQSERAVPDYGYMLEQQLLYQIARCVMELDDYGTIDI